MRPLDHMIALLRCAATEIDQRKECIREFQNAIENSESVVENEQIDDILNTLAYDLSYDCAGGRYDEEYITREIQAVLSRLKQMGYG
jgi:archaellum biogenesis protein FlaJ (TadC family)